MIEQSAVQKFKASLRGQVIYEMHVGAFTKEGTWEAAGREVQRVGSAEDRRRAVLRVGRPLR